MRSLPSRYCTLLSSLALSRHEHAERRNVSTMTTICVLEGLKIEIASWVTVLSTERDSIFAMSMIYSIRRHPSTWQFHRMNPKKCFMKVIHEMDVKMCHETVSWNDSFLIESCRNFWFGFEQPLLSQMYFCIYHWCQKREHLDHICSN